MVITDLMLEPSGIGNKAPFNDDQLFLFATVFVSQLCELY